jgi:hypothetical protein
MPEDYLYFWADLWLTTGDTVPRGLVRAEDNLTIVRAWLLPAAAFTKDGSNYWTFSLPVYDETGARVRIIPFDEQNPKFSLNDRSLAEGRAVALPFFGWIEKRVQKDETLYVKPEETGTAAALKVRFFVAATQGVR